MRVASLIAQPNPLQNMHKRPGGFDCFLQDALELEV